MDWNDRRTPPNKVTHISAALGATYAVDPKARAKPASGHTVATTPPAGFKKPKPLIQDKQLGKKR